MRRSNAPTFKRAQKLASSNSDDATSSNRVIINRSTVNPSSTTNQSGSDQSKRRSDDHQVFTTVYGVYKPGKKHKEWQDDAILERDGQSIKVFNLEGERIASSIYDKQRPMKPDDILRINKHEYMIIDPVEIEKFKSGACFTQAYNFNRFDDENKQDASLEQASSLKRKSDSSFVCPVKLQKTDNEIIEGANVIANKPAINQHIDNLTKENEPHDKSSQEQFQAFVVLTGDYKPNKKHKDWQEDAVLVRLGNNLTLYNTEGDKLESEIFNKGRPLKVDDVFFVCGKEIKLVHPIEKEDFVSKKCFSKNYTPAIKDDAEDKPTKRFKSFRSVLTDQTESAFNNAKCPKSIVNEEQDLSFFETTLILPKLPENACRFYQEPKAILVDHELNKCLREHQREGIEFMYKCIMGFYDRIEGCILADEMGLGKTLQCIVLIYTLLKNGPYGVPFFRRVIVFAPSSLVKNWEKEFDKWLKGRKVYAYAIDGKKKNVKDFLKKNPSTYPVLIISYDTFYRNQDKLSILNFDLIVCDEGHRLKNSKVKIFEAIEQMSCKRRIILSGTPVQNNLKELYSLSNLVCPGILGSKEDFSMKYEEPIQEAQKQCDEDKLQTNREANINNLNKVSRDIRAKLFEILGQFILRREQSYYNYLPKKVENVIICKLTDLQERIYKVLLNDKKLKKILADEGESTGINNVCLPYISFLRKLSNHPFLVNADIIKKSYELKDASLINELWPEIKRLFDDVKKGVLNKSGKFDTLVRILEVIKHNEEKVVIVSHFTQTLDLIEQFCNIKNYQISRLDGSTPVAKRQKLVDEFNSERSKTFAFLLSSKAGGLGLNLIGASHIILYDIDWNPAHDEQSKCRIYRDGQNKTSNIYRLLTAGTIDEKMFQRQLDKQNLKSALGADENELNFLKRDLKDIFSLDPHTLSSTHESINCDCLLRKQQEPDESTEPDDTQQTQQQQTQQHETEYRSTQVEEMELVRVKNENLSSFSEEELNLAINQDESSNDSTYSNNIQQAQDDHNDENDENKGSQKTDEDSNDNTMDSLLHDGSNVDLDYILSNSSEKRDFDNDEESTDQPDSSNEDSSLRVGLTKSKNRASEHISKWEHFSSPFDNSDMSSILFEARNTITFVFKSETGDKC